MQWNNRYPTLLIELSTARLIQTESVKHRLGEEVEFKQQINSNYTTTTRYHLQTGSIYDTVLDSRDCRFQTWTLPPMENAAGVFLSQTCSWWQEHSGEEWHLGRECRGLDKSCFWKSCFCLQRIDTSVCSYQQNLSNLVVCPIPHLPPLHPCVILISSHHNALVVKSVCTFNCELGEKRKRPFTSHHLW